MGKEIGKLETQEKLLEEERPVEIQNLAERLKVFVGLVKKVSVFSKEENDEFRVIREDGKINGIFKTWAVPVIPFLETGQEKELSEALSQSNFSLLQEKDSLKETIQNWDIDLRENPTRLWQTLEKWRGFSEIYDRRLYQIFKGRELPANKIERSAELFLRMQVAFGLAAPFYHLEAMVGDSNRTQFNPVTINEGNGNGGGGVLDIAGMVLPSMLSDRVLSSRLEWNGLNWEKVKNLSQFSVEDKSSVLAFRLARELGVQVEDVIFAANVLEWIPASVGGKKADLDQSEAIRIFSVAFEKSFSLSNISVARDMNAKIRFLNWFPLVREEANFSQGEGWRYAAVCDTANLLMKEINNKGLLLPGFEQIFTEKLSKQLANIDATSAKGRFILQLAGEGKMLPEFYSMVSQRTSAFLLEIAMELHKLQEEEAILDVFEVSPRFQVGGKAAGLSEAALIFGKEKVVPGFVVTTEKIEEWLKSDEGTWNLILEMDQEKDLEVKLAIAEEVRESILGRTFNIPPQLALKLSTLDWQKIAIRSTSFDEDTVIIGGAAGVYESEVGIDVAEMETAIKQVISSFFSNKAVSYREIHGFFNKPMFALIASPFFEGVGGVVFSAGNGCDWEVSVGKTPDAIVKGKAEDFDNHKQEGGEMKSDAPHGWLTEEKINEIGKMALTAEKAIGNKVDIEFVVDKVGQAKVLQLRSLYEKEEAAPVTETMTTDREILIEDLTDLGGAKVNKGEKIRMVIGTNIDINQFQGDLNRWIVKNRGILKEIVMLKRIPRTSHFANVCLNLGIKLSFRNDK